MNLNELSHLDIERVESPDIKARAEELAETSARYLLLRHIKERIEILWEPELDSLMIAWNGERAWGTRCINRKETRLLEQAIRETIEYKAWAKKRFQILKN